MGAVFRTCHQRDQQDWCVPTNLSTFHGNGKRESLDKEQGSIDMMSDGLSVPLMLQSASVIVPCAAWLRPCSFTNREISERKKRMHSFSHPLLTPQIASLQRTNHILASTSDDDRATLLFRVDDRCTLDTALAIVPPDDAWDRLQRARHVAKDLSYSQWPPAIRLFHPFCEPQYLHDVALDIAGIIEAYNVGPFAVTLSEWSIVPHAEAMEAYLQSIQPDHSISSDAEDLLTPEERRVRALIEKEERLGKEKLRVRLRQQKKKDQMNGAKDSELSGRNTSNKAAIEVTGKTKNSSSSLQEQKNMYQEFNGPCVICLEPDHESRAQIQAVRYLLQKELDCASNFSHLYSVSSSMSLSGSTTTSTNEGPFLRSRKHNLRKSRKFGNEPESFRPVVPVASFTTVSSAILVAQKLRKLWKPLTFNVTDLHLLSRGESNDVSTEAFSLSNDKLSESYSQTAIPRADHKSGFKPTSAEELHFHGTKEENQFTCEAIVSFTGCEIEMDEDLNEQMAKMVFEQGESGGFETTEISLEESGIFQDTIENGATKEFEKWLAEDDEIHDEGTVLVIGRTQFFTGNSREYLGMPASSALDSRDNINSEHFVSGAARRRGSVSRSGRLFDDGDWGQKQVDYSAFSRGEKKAFLDTGDSDMRL